MVGIYRNLARATAFLHVLWIITVVGGVFLSPLFPEYLLPYLIVLAITIGAQALWRGCPLTAIEKFFRAKYETSYQGTFLDHYLKPWGRVLLVWQFLGLYITILFLQSGWLQ